MPKARVCGTQRDSDLVGVPRYRTCSWPTSHCSDIADHAGRKIFLLLGPSKISEQNFED
ncbi:predicted protein [Sclerotinia sclerotiorum 1980 UF-70]|uniref:Uncharacterized protein n=1 Tax=Sclerotinia sclerotiorum (strain ATCC 18683 / 1980 / Ss-1) TaxID=665079 RepID=A7EV06_SCLS1|nr:predicted protein [Sclerotinia sclerotiorum 1980 UF-70]EDN93298.1 predicted protein [Sclerotinia sclerotiorum 1980 UF-70]